MEKLGFAERWINLVIACVSTISYSFKLNGKLVGYVFPKRDIRQGDPFLCFYMFYVRRGFRPCLMFGKLRTELGGESMQRCPAVNYLLFADDSFIFARSTRQECL